MEFEKKSFALSGLFEGLKWGRDEITVLNNVKIKPDHKNSVPLFSDVETTNVIRSVCDGAPLGIFYIMEKPDGSREIMDGRKRVEALCSAAARLDGSEDTIFGIDKELFARRVKDGTYTLDFVICKGTAGELFDWFQRINVIESKRSSSWLFSRVYGSAWLDDVNRRFEAGSKEYDSVLGFDGVPTPERVSRVIDWAANGEDISPEQYMSEHQTEPDGSRLWAYFEAVGQWVSQVFGSNAGKLGAQEWGCWYNDYSREFSALKAEQVQGKVYRLLEDPDVTAKSGIVEYILTGDMSVLKLRKLSEKDKIAAIEAQGGKCADCGCELDAKSAKATLKKPWPNGSLCPQNTEVLCKKCDAAKKKRIMQAFG